MYNNKYNNLWTNEQIEYLKNNYENKSQKKIALELGKSHTTVSKKMFELGLITTYKKRYYWSEDDTNFLKENYLSMTYRQIAIALDKSKPSVDNKAKKLGLQKVVDLNQKNYTDTEISFLKQNISKMTYKQMADSLGRTTMGIAAKCSNLGIIPEEYKKRIKLKKEQILFILENCMNYTDNDLALKFNVSETAIRDVRKKYGIKKTGNEVSGPTYIEKIVKSVLENLNIDFIYNEYIGPYKPDFFISSKKLIIEVQGDYYHCNPYLYKTGPKDDVQIKHVLRDYYKKCYFLSRGYILLEVWEHEINKDIDKVIEKIKTAVLT